VKVTVFTSNQPRHIGLLEALAEVAETVVAVQECTTVFPGQVEDFYSRSDTMRAYFERMIAAEEHVFGRPRSAPVNVRTLALKMGDLNRFAMADLHPLLDADAFVVFGASYIRGPLATFLVRHRACNIHMGTSPYYRGSGTNFWALYDGRPEYVGATIHLLSRGLDSGPMLFHALPAAQAVGPFVLGMRAVRSAHQGLIKHLRTGELTKLAPVEQDKALEMRYSRYEDFTDQAVAEYLARVPTPDSVREALQRRDLRRFVRPYVGA